MPLRIRILTFDRLPNRQLVGELSPFTDVYEKLDSTASYFENYHLQSPGWNSVLGNPNDATAVADLLRQNQQSAVIVQSENSEAPPPGTFPDWLRSQTFDHTGDLSLPDNCAVVWLHCSLALQPDTADRDAARLDECLQVIRCLDPESISPLIFSALRGCDSPEEFPFDSQLFDGKIRVPLWLETSQNKCSRVQTIAGSFDVMQTVRRCFHPTEQQLALAQDSFHPLSLLTQIEKEGQLPDRQLLVQTTRSMAIRTAKFLFAQKSDSHDKRESHPADAVDSALYSKPEDMWNIRDVAAEYHDLMSDFAQLIVQHSK